MRLQHIAFTILAALSLCAAQTGSGHGNHNNPCTGPHSNDPGCGGGEPPGGSLIFEFDVLTLSGPGDYLTNDGGGTYEHAQNKVTAQQEGDVFAKLSIGEKGNKPSNRKIYVDVDLGAATVPGVSYTPGPLGALVLIGNGQDLSELSGSEPTTFWMRAIVDGGWLLISYDDPDSGTLDACDGTAEGNRVTTTRGPGGEWVVTANSLLPGCAFLFDGQGGVSSPVAVPLDFTFTLSESP